MSTVSHYAAATVAGALSFCATAHGSSVLLASIDREKGASTAGTDLALEPYVVFLLQVTDTLGDPAIELGAEISWTDGDSGNVEFNASTSDQFNDFASMLTNGRDDWLGDGIGFSDGSSVAAYAPESVRLQRNPDFFDYDVQFIRFIVRDVQIIPYESQEFPDLDGLTVSANVTYEFYGSPIPEPATLALIAVASPLLLRRERRRSRSRNR